jgi:hypothetical protein
MRGRGREEGEERKRKRGRGRGIEEEVLPILYYGVWGCED